MGYDKGIVVSLCDRSGNMVLPWAEEGYECYAVDVERDSERVDSVGEGCIHYVESDVRDWTVPEDDVEIGFAFPPCTDLAVSGARWFREKGLKRLADAIYLVAECQEMLVDTGAPYMIENPVSTLSTYWRDPDYMFHPCEYDGFAERDERYTKKTCLWTGHGFQMPDVDGVDPSNGDDRIHKMPPGEERSRKRSETPMGFARAVFEANHDTTPKTQTGIGDNL